MSLRMTMSCGSISPASFACASSPEMAKMEDVGALARVLANALAEEIGDIGSVVDHKDADAHADLPKVLRLATAAADGR
jgi:hypothetical protein